MAVRLQFVPRREPPDLLDLPWETPLEEWQHPRMVRMAKGVSRHVVRFVSDGERAFALKETRQGDAEREYAMLRHLAVESLPVVEVVGLVTGRADPEGQPLGAVLVTRYLDFALPFRYLFSIESGHGLGRKLVDAAQAFLFDEPLSNLDAKLRGQMRTEISRLQRRLGVTTVSSPTTRPRP